MGPRCWVPTANPIVPPEVKCSQVIRQEVADGVTYALEGVMDYGTGKRLGIGRPAAGKTGTAQNNTHLWFVGFTPQMVAAVWTGNAEGDIPLQCMSINGRSTPKLLVRRRHLGPDLAGLHVHGGR